MSNKEEIFEYPKWMECQWRREPCNKVECPLCHRLMKQEQKHKLRGEDPNSMEAALNDVAESFEETKMLLKEDCKKFDIDLDNLPDAPEMPDRDLMEHPLNKLVFTWIKNVHNFICKVYDTEPTWLGSEEWKDLQWYHTMLGAKVYRQLCNKWDMENIDMDQSDYVYTKGVIEEIINILKIAFKKLLSFDLNYPERSNLQGLFDEFSGFEKDLLSI